MCPINNKNEQMTIRLADMVAAWDLAHEAQLPEDADPQQRRPYNKLLEPLSDIATLRFQPYQNDSLPDFIEKLRNWLKQFSTDDDKRIAFLLALKIIFIGQRQFEVLQRILFKEKLSRHLIEAIIQRKHLDKLDFPGAAIHFDEEMDKTLFIANSDSSQLNSFVHVNRGYFHDRERRKLTGPEVAFWTYPSYIASLDQTPAEMKKTCATFETDVLAKDPRIIDKSRLIILEDFSGSGSDLETTLKRIHTSQLPIQEVILAPVMATAAAITRVQRYISGIASQNKRSYCVMSAFELPEKYRCYGGTEGSYLDGVPPELALSVKVKNLAEDVYRSHLAKSVDIKAKHGFSNLALAFSFYTNCPDNTLPMIWANCSTWKGLFPRASRYL